MNKTIISDIDDSVAFCAPTLQKFIEDEFGLFSELQLKDHHNIPKLYGLDEERTLEIVSAFHRSEVFGHLPAMECASVVLPELHRRGYRFIGVTACLNEPKVVEARRNNLKQVFGFEWDEVHCIGLSHTKRAALEAFEPAIWVDDLARHAKDGAEVGHRTFLIDKNYNKDFEHKDVTRVKDWHEIMEHLE